MKLAYKLFLILSSIALFSCMEEAFVEGPTAAQGLTAEIPSYQFDNQTRVNISQNLSTFTWSDGDQIGIYGEGQYNNEGNAAFTIKNGGSNSGVFTNDIFALKPNSTYYAFYPYDSKVRIEAYTVDFTGQVQTANGSTAHIGARNYMSAEVNTDASGAANISFQNLAAVIQVVIPIEESDTYTRVILASESADFVSEGILNMKTGSMTANANSPQMTVTLGQGIAMNQGETLVVNILTAPVDLNGKTLSAILETSTQTFTFENLKGMNIEKGMAYKVDCKTEEIEETPYLTFTAESEQTLRMSKAVETLEYSVNGGDWLALGTNVVTFGGANGDLRLRGKSHRGTALDDNTSQFSFSQITFGTSAATKVSGDIRTLIDYDNYDIVDTSSAKFKRLFYNCVSLISAPALPSLRLSYACYESMFEGCRNLQKTPELPAKTLLGSDFCYSRMFYGCITLVAAPELPATTVTYGCYNKMFYGCTALSSAPNLPAEKLYESSYQQMFYGCTSLETAPSLPAKELGWSCYEGMFQHCTSLTEAPELPAIDLYPSCYNSMFQGCTSLTSAPDLQAPTLAYACYANMFYDCSALTKAPELPARTLASSCYSNMFKGCSLLTTAPSLYAETLTNNCYSGMFEDCSNLKSITMMAKDISGDNSLNNWATGVSSSGTFIQNEDIELGKYVPANWYIVFASANYNSSVSFYYGMGSSIPTNPQTSGTAVEIKSDIWTLLMNGTQDVRYLWIAFDNNIALSKVVDTWGDNILTSFISSGTSYGYRTSGNYKIYYINTNNVRDIAYQQYFFTFKK